MRLPKISQPNSTTAFSLVELLVSIGIIAVLGSLSVGALNHAKNNAAMTSEISAAKSLITAYLAYTTDNDGRLLPGVKIETTTTDRHGALIASPSLSKRWPLRLAPYFEHDYAGTAVVNQMLQEYRKAGQAKIMNVDSDEYIASATPSFGLNSTFTGGNYIANQGEPLTSEANRYGDFYVSRTASAEKPNELIVFASARSRDAGSEVQSYGNLYVFAPRLNSGLRWSNLFEEKSAASLFGNVHPRWNKRAVVACLAGNVSLLDENELKDMRRWSNQAGLADNPNWELQSSP